MKKFKLILIFKLLVIFPIFLFAKNICLDFSVCYQKYKNISFLIPVTKNRAITFIKQKKFIFYDPFTKMYVVNNTKTPVIFYSSAKLGWFMAAINSDVVYGGTFAKDMLFLKPAKLSIKTPVNTIISDIFCRAYGVGNDDGFIKSEYIKHFVKYGYWGDIGIEVDKEMIVKYIDPFYVKGIKVGDKIISINNQKATPKTFSKYILLGKIGNEVKIKTKNSVVYLKIRKKIYNFTPLIHFGIVVDKKLNVIKIPKSIYQKTFIKPPAKLVAINNIKINSFDELKRVLSFYKNVTITLKKDGINIKIPLRQ